MTKSRAHRVGLLHYSVPPVIGGVESVILAHLRLLIASGHACVVLAGRGDQKALPAGADFVHIPELDSQHPEVLQISQELEGARVPASFDPMVDKLVKVLAPILGSIDLLIVHNVFTKHFNLPLTAALSRLMDGGTIRRCIAWCHDITWTSPRSRSKVHPGLPWDLLRTYRSNVVYVAVSRERQRELADLFGCPPERIRVVYNGVDPNELFALSAEGRALIDRLDLWESDLNLLMPVRVTRAKNIELALQVTAALKEHDVDPRLVVTGPPDPHDRANMEYFERLLALRERLGIQANLRFVYESGPSNAEPYLMDMSVVAGLFRLSDALFMPSHSEGFGMPVLEAGLAGMPVFCSDQIPAANELGGQDVFRFSPRAGAEEVTRLIRQWMETSPVLRLRRRVRQSLTWDRLFQGEILPLLQEGAA